MRARSADSGFAWGVSATTGQRTRLVLTDGMRNPIDLTPREAVLVLCTLVLLVLVYAEGWIWPLKAAACMIPVSLLVG